MLYSLQNESLVQGFNNRVPPRLHQDRSRIFHPSKGPACLKLLQDLATAEIGPIPDTWLGNRTFAHVACDFFAKSLELRDVKQQQRTVGVQVPPAQLQRQHAELSASIQRYQHVIQDLLNMDLDHRKAVLGVRFSDAQVLITSLFAFFFHHVLCSFPSPQLNAIL